MPARADQRGLFFEINPYNSQGSCNHDGSGWLYANQCGTAQVPNYVPQLYKGGFVGGVTFKIPWDAFAYDSGYTQLYTVLRQLNSLAPTGGKINLKVGLIAGKFTPCEVLNAEQQYSIGGGTYAIGDQVTFPSGITQCMVLPSVYSNVPTANAYPNAYGQAATTLMSVVANYLSTTNGNNITLVAVKIAGMNGEDLETHIPGDNNPHQYTGTAAQKQCQNGTITNYFCPDVTTRPMTMAFWWLNNYQYYPLGVYNSWNLITGQIISALPTINPQPVVEIQAESTNEFPPIVARDFTFQQPDFNCSYVGQPNPPYDTCVIYDGGNASQTDTDNIGLVFTESYLIQSTYSVLPAQALGVEYDGLSYNTIKDHPAIVTPPPESQKDNPACWAYNNSSHKTFIGMQTAGISQQNSGSDYIGALNYGISFGATFIETWPDEANAYIASAITPAPQQVQQYEQNLKDIQNALIANQAANNTNCQP